MRSHRGYAWTNASLEAKHWIIDVSLRITGRLKTGADGMVREGREGGREGGEGRGGEGRGEGRGGEEGGEEVEGVDRGKGEGRYYY